ncbi:hypothetical protein [Paraburkholderia sp.]|uniref:hypothetical protein n=1 Tax=Paraburkholderia sp. TaxID=1926495 RepID=UPI0026011646|nr:hypothetical protein [Paraburkholderia sp.]
MTLLPYISAVCAAVSLVGCIGVNDSRTVEQKQSDLRAATDALVGTYEVVDSRLNNLHVTNVVVRKTIGSYGPNVTLMNQDFQSAVFHGSKACNGYVVKGGAYAAVMCETPAYDVNFYDLDLVTYANRTIKNGGIIKAFPDMTVPPGNFVLSYAETNGRMHYLVLAKKTTP